MGGRVVVVVVGVGFFLVFFGIVGVEVVVVDVCFGRRNIYLDKCSLFF